MKCPIGQTELMMTERQGTEIDYCPKCRGVWLDRGELDKLIERSGAAERSYSREDARPQYRESGYEPRHKKRQSLLGELFDF